jgi:hypothetical protein
MGEFILIWRKKLMETTEAIKEKYFMRVIRNIDSDKKRFYRMAQNHGFDFLGKDFLQDNWDGLRSKALTNKQLDFLIDFIGIIPDFVPDPEIGYCNENDEIYDLSLDWDYIDGLDKCFSIGYDGPGKIYYAFWEKNKHKEHEGKIDFNGEIPDSIRKAFEKCFLYKGD